METGLFLKEVGEKIRKARMERNITQRQLCSRIDLGLVGLSFIENGKSNLYILTLKSIANALEMDVKEFF